MSKPNVATIQVRIPKQIENEVKSFCEVNGIEVASITPEIVEQILAIKKSIRDLAIKNKVKISSRRKKEITLIAESQIERVIRLLTGMTGLAVTGMKPQELKKLVREIVFEAIENVIERG